MSRLNPQLANTDFKKRSEKAKNTGISIIVPVYNEADIIEQLVERLFELQRKSPVPVEVLYCDAASPDGTGNILEKLGGNVLQSPRRGRANQMNFGAAHATYDILYFLHADTLPPQNTSSQLISAVAKGYESGCFRLRFDEENVLMRFYSWFTRFDLLPFRFGDQSLFVLANVFKETRGFREDHIVMEDNEFIRRLRKRKTFCILNDFVYTSARKYRENGFVKLQFIFTIIFLLYYLGFSQDALKRFYLDNVRNAGV
ncbi:MAG: TIGR04283 family arsenosugar biosynthesis glycosyltransferase [Balneolales bacterium]|nr:TIGR04283 family arsenosugar biosynthesis glycosyltransferase [Balneolales bacterium]